MATPEEWAEQVVGVVILDGRSPEGWLEGIKQAIASYIEEAVEDERERCAKIADEYHRIDTPGEIGREIREGK
jgi:hypothetical protein